MTAVSHGGFGPTAGGGRTRSMGLVRSGGVAAVLGGDGPRHARHGRCGGHQVHHQQRTHIGVIVLTMLEDDDAVFAAIRVGARGYLPQGARRAEIIRAPRAIADGDAVFGGAIAGRVIRYFDPPAAPSPPPGFPGLTTSREAQVLTLMATTWPTRR